MDPDEYEQVFTALKMGHHGATRAFKEKSKTWYKVSRFLRQWPGVQIRTLQNPVSGNMEERLVLPGNDSFRIIIRTTELDSILSSFYRETVGDGAGKLSRRIQKVFCRSQ